MKKTDVQLKLYLSAILLVLFMVIPVSAEVIPAYTGVYVQASNDDGILYDYTGNGTYYIMSNGGGLSAVHITTNFTEADGQVTVSENQSGTFWITDTGGRGYQDDIVLMLAINGTISDDFAVRIRTGGYTWAPSAVANTAPATGVPVYSDTTLDETFTRSDFIYGPQSWKPQGSDELYPLFYGEDTGDAVNQFYLAFIDTSAGVLGTKYSGYSDLTDQGAVKVEYEFTSLNGYAAFNVYGWNNATSQGRGMGWTNMVSGDGSNGYSVVGTPAEPLVEAPVASFKAHSTWGEALFTVRFNDTSTNSPTSWEWDFGDGSNSTASNPLHTYDTPGKYTVNLTATNSAGSDTATVTDYITVAEAGSSFLAGSAWPEFGYDSNNTGRSIHNGPQTPALNWTCTIDRVIGGNGVAIGSDGMIYIGSYQNSYLFAVYPNGTIYWKYPLESYQTPAISSDGTIYVGHSGGWLYAFNPDGSVKWSTEEIASGSCSPVIGPDGTIYTTYGLNFKAVYPNGTVKWTYSTGSSFWYSAAAIAPDGTIYIGNSGDTLYAFNPDGSVKWEYSTGSPIRMSPSVGSDGTIYIGCADGCLYAVSSDGILKWKTEVSSSELYFGSAIGSDGTIYAASTSGTLAAVNPGGNLKWTYDVGNYVGAAPVLGADGTIYIGGTTSSVFEDSGRFIHYDPTSTAGSLYAINPDGTVKWEYSLPGLKGTPAIGSDGTLYVASGYYDSSGHGYLYSFENVVDFTTDQNSGQSPLNVQFNGVSSRNVSSWYWDFGDGTNFTGKNPPAHEYTSGSYTVDLTITTTGGETFSAVKSGYISAYNTPQAAFGVDVTSGTIPMTVDFTDKSTNNATEWFWDFGDGSTSTLQNPTHTYYSKGTYTIELTVENPAGSTSHTETGYITVGDQPVPLVDFNSSATSGQAPFEVTFTDLSANTPLLSWEWDFGDGKISTEQNPAHTYDIYGNYTVGLTVTNYGGQNSTTKAGYVNVTPQDPPIVSFEANTTLGLPPLSVAFTDTSTGYNITGWYWDFDDGTNSTEQHPVHSFGLGEYNVSLTVTNDGGSNVTSSPIIVKDMVTPVADFSANRTYGRYPTVQFTDESTFEPTSWSWDFGDGETSTDQNPVHTYSNIGNYTVILTVSNAAGSGTVTKTDYIECSYTNAQPLPSNQCLNLYVANDEGVKYNVENGITDTQMGYSPYVFVNNTYFLIWSGTAGGTNAFHVTTDPVWPNNYGQVTKTTNRSGEFYLTHTGGQPNLHDAVLLLAVNGIIPDDFSVHIRSTGYDFKPPTPSIKNNDSISAVTYVEGATDQTFTREDFIYGPQIWRPHRVSDYPIFVGQNMSDTSNTFEMMFIDLRLGCTQTLSDGYIKVEYEFNNLTSFAVFNGYGWYSASNHGTGIIMATSGSEYQVVGITEPPVAGFTVSDMAGTTLEPVQFTDISSGGPYSWYWDFGDGTNFTGQNPPEHIYSEPGEYTVKLTATNYRGSNTKSITIKQISGILPEPDFTVDATTGVSPFDVTFTDISTNSPVSWYWDFGDGTTSTEQNPKHRYGPGIHTVSLTVENNGGNTTHTEEELIVVSGDSSARIVNPGFETGDLTGWDVSYSLYEYATSAKVYSGSYSLFMRKGSEKNAYQSIDLTGVTSISFWGYTEKNPQYFNTYIDGVQVQSDTSNTRKVWTQYIIPISNYTGFHELNIEFYPNKAGNGYIDDISLEVGASSAAPVTRFAATSNTSGEYPLTVQFTDASSNYPTEWAWDFNGDGVVDSNEQSPSYTFKTVGTYKVSLTTKNGEGDDSAVRANYITVKGVKKITTDVSIRNNGTLTDNGNGKKQYTVNQSEAKVEGNDIVIDSGSYTVKIKSDNAPATTGGNIVAEVAGIELETDPVEAILDELGNVSGSVNLELNDLPEDSGLEVTIEKGNSGKGTAFQIAANSGGLSVDNVAYTMNIVKTNLTNGQEIKEAKITMSVPESWVGANGGKDAIKIIRIAEDGKKEVLGTTYVGTTDGIMTFEGYSPNGLSMFGLVSTTEQPASPAPLNRGGSLAPSAGGQSDIGIDGAENLKAGDTATLYFDETGIYEMDLCAKEDIPEVFITVEAGITPEGAISPEGDLFEYIAAFLYDTEAESVSKYTVRFAVPTDWVNGRLSSPDLLSLYWYDEDKDEWTKLSTVFDSEKDGVCYYYADTASIGYLAIAAVPDLDQVKSPSLKSEAVGQTTLATAEKSTASVTTAATPKATPLFGDITIFVVFGLLCVIAIVNRRCRKTNKK